MSRIARVRRDRTALHGKRSALSRFADAARALLTSPVAPSRPRVGAPSRTLSYGFSRVRMERWRLNTLLLLTLLFFGGVLARLGYVQLLNHDIFYSKARWRFDQMVVINPTRGMITDRTGQVLAMDADRRELAIDPQQIDSGRVDEVAKELAPILGRPIDEIQTILSNRSEDWVILERWLTPDAASKVVDTLLRKGEPGIYLKPNPKRVYPQGSFAAHLLGAVNYDGDGISGLEAFLNGELKGESGFREGTVDGNMRLIAIAPMVEKPPQDGVQLQTTIDPYIQFVSEQALTTAIQKHQADSGTIIVLDVRTGAIRGMASWPIFDPNNYGRYPPEVYGRNPAISSLYEPGSTFKMITVAAGLQSRAFTADTSVADSGSIWRYGTTLSNWDGLARGMLDSTGVLYHSSNVGALLLNELTGPEAFYQVVADFGFGRPTGVELSGEEGGIVNALGTPSYNDLTFLTNAYGQGISVTPLQMVVAAAAIANDGVMMKPFIIERRCQQDVCTETKPQELGRPIEPGVAWTIRRMLVHSANHYAPVVWKEQTGNGGDQWLLPGYQIAAKTGTSSIPLPTGGYDQNFTIGSVLGFGPAEQARFAVLVKIDRPKDDIWGVNTAIPVFYQVMEELMRHEQVPPDPTLVSPGQVLPS